MSKSNLMEKLRFAGVVFLILFSIYTLIGWFLLFVELNENDFAMQFYYYIPKPLGGILNILCGFIWVAILTLLLSGDDGKGGKAVDHFVGSPTPPIRIWTLYRK